MGEDQLTGAVLHSIVIFLRVKMGDYNIPDFTELLKSPEFEIKMYY